METPIVVYLDSLCKLDREQLVQRVASTEERCVLQEGLINHLKSILDGSIPIETLGQEFGSQESLQNTTIQEFLDMLITSKLTMPSLL